MYTETSFILICARACLMEITRNVCMLSAAAQTVLRQFVEEKSAEILTGFAQKQTFSFL